MEDLPHTPFNRELLDVDTDAQDLTVSMIGKTTKSNSLVAKENLAKASLHAELPKAASVIMASESVEHMGSIIPQIARAVSLEIVPSQLDGLDGRDGVPLKMPGSS
jgi:hypothetical protein